MRNKPGFVKFFGLVFIPLLLLISLSSIVFAEEIKVAADPTRIGVGARSLGMGKMGLSLGDDCGAIFMNPAGISGLQDWQIVSMAGRFIGEIDYLQFGGTYKTDYGTFGLGYVGASIGAEFARGVLISFEGEFRVIATGETDTYSYNDSVFLLSYGSRLRDFTEWEWVRDLSVGANLKVFAESLTGTEIREGTGNGWDMDLGLLYQPLPWLSAGVTGQNIIPEEMGAKIFWKTGAKESIPSLVKFGTSARLVGNDAPITYGEHELIAGLDADWDTSGSNAPMLFHLGLEWWPIEYVALRAGVDQDWVGSGSGRLETTNNLTAGVGLLYGGFRFDYAFHQYNNIIENDTHYFSLCYNIWKEKKEAPKPVVSEYLKLAQPMDKSTYYTDKVTILGQVNPEVKRVTVNNVNVPVSASGSISFDQALAVGKNSLNVVAYDGLGNTVSKMKVRVLRLLSFKDVPKDYWASGVVQQIASIGIVTGYPDGTFRPEGSINRAEMTTLLVRALGEKLPDVTENVFGDLPPSHWAARYIKEGVNRKYVLGYPDGTFRPANSINKAEGVVVLARFGELAPPEKVLEGPFADVPGRHWAAPLITAAKENGYLKYLEGKNFEPAKELSRAEAVEILSKTKFAKGKVSDLLDFESGY